MSTETNETPTGLQIGDTVASIIAPAERHGRIVGFRKRGRKDKRVIVREFTDGDDWFPTGDYRYTAPDAVTPWPGEAAQ